MLGQAQSIDHRSGRWSCFLAAQLLRVCTLCRVFALQCLATLAKTLRSSLWRYCDTGACVLVVQLSEVVRGCTDLSLHAEHGVAALQAVGRSSSRCRCSLSVTTPSVLASGHCLTGLMVVTAALSASPTGNEEAPEPTAFRVCAVGSAVPPFQQSKQLARQSGRGVRISVDAVATAAMAFLFVEVPAQAAGRVRQRSTGCKGEPHWSPTLLLQSSIL